MPNEGFRVAPDGKSYPRLRVCKIEGSAYPWKVQKLYGQGPYATKLQIWEGNDALTACLKAGETLDAGIAALKAQAAQLAKGKSKRYAQTPQEIRNSVNYSLLPQRPKEFMS